eukprot:gene14194-20164_t
MLQEFNISIDALHGDDYSVRDILEPYVASPEDLEDVTATWQLNLKRLTDWYPDEYQESSNGQPLACQVVSDKDIKMINPFADTGTHRQHIAHYITTLEDKFDNPNDVHHRGPQRPKPTRTNRERLDT